MGRSVARWKVATRWNARSPTSTYCLSAPRIRRSSTCCDKNLNGVNDRIEEIKNGSSNNGGSVASRRVETDRHLDTSRTGSMGDPRRRALPAKENRARNPDSGLCGTDVPLRDVHAR